MGPKNQILKQGDRAQLFNPFDSSRRDSHFSTVFVCQNWMKMAKLLPWEARAPKWHLAYFVPIDGHFGQVFEIWTSNLFCSVFTLTLIYKPSLKSIRPKLAILSQKTPKTHQSGHISKPHFAQGAVYKGRPANGEGVVLKFRTGEGVVCESSDVRKFRKKSNFQNFSAL